MRILCRLLGIMIITLSLNSCITVNHPGIGSFTDLESFYESNGYQKHTTTMPVTYLDGYQWLDRLEELIREAEDYILVDVFLANTVDINEHIYELLRQRHDEGIRIYFLYDSSSNVQPYLDRPEYAPSADTYLREVGIPVTEYNPLIGSRVPLGPILFDRDHRKFWIIDGKVVALGGINLNYSSFNNPVNRGHIDSMTEFSSSTAIRQLIESFIESWNAYSLQKLSIHDFSVPPQSEESSLYLFDQGFGDEDQVLTMIDGLFASAEDEIWMTQAFAFLTPNLLEKIERLESRGVDVHIVYSETGTGIQYLAAAKYPMTKLLETGAEAHYLHSPDGAFTHLKFIAVDDTAVSLGSANYNIRSYGLSREISIVSTDEEFISYTWEWFSGMQGLLHEITYEQAAEYRDLEYLLYYLFMLYGG